ncbi:MAG TPA: lipase maturation factor family protein [Thermoanaerobaculia bacterium]
MESETVPRRWHDSFSGDRHHLTRRVFQRGLALVYLIAFLVAANQFVPLLGERGLLPVPRFVQAVPFAASPSLFFLWPRDSAFVAAAWLGVALALVALTGLSERRGWLPSALTWGALWVLYLSFVNVGQVFYGFGWETMLLEAGFLAIFLGGERTAPSIIPIVLIRWMLFRTMFGAGLIKIRGDTCWRDLTCLYYHYETQPMPNPLSWYFHWLPKPIHKFGVLFNHFTELVVPFGYFAPQPIAAIAGVVTIFFHVWLMASGNFSFLGLMTIVLAISTLDDRFLARALRLVPRAGALPSRPHRRAAASRAQRGIVRGLAVLVALLSIAPTVNLLSPRQAMNTSYDPLHLVNSYGAFGSITRPRYEVVVFGTSAPTVDGQTPWREYAFKAKPGDLHRTPPQIAPYHLRLDWLMWFCGFTPWYGQPWFANFMAKLLQNDARTLSLMAGNPFPDEPPRFVRALLFEYRFTTPEERRKTGDWWVRHLQGEYFPIVSLDDPDFRALLQREGWMEPAPAAR